MKELGVRSRVLGVPEYFLLALHGVYSWEPVWEFPKVTGLNMDLGRLLEELHIRSDISRYN